MFVTDGFEEIEAVGTYAILRRGGLDVDVYSLLDKNATGRFGLTLTDLKPFSAFNPAEYDALILPGGPEYKAMEANADVQKYIRQFAAEDKWLCAICAGPTIFGHAGLLKGKKYTCFTDMNEDFGGFYQDDYAVTDGKIITGKSAAATIDFAFAVLAAVAGKDVADKTKQGIYYKG